MAYRKTSRRRFQVSQVLPVWGSAQQSTADMAFAEVMLNLGVTDIPSYLSKFRFAIAISIVICASYGATSYGLTGLALGTVAGLGFPAALTWLTVMFVGIVLYLAAWCFAAAMVFTVCWWLLTAVIGG
jgi:hypothetical protein